MAKSEVKIIAEHLSYKFSSKNILFDDLNFQVCSGQILGIIGRNGAGKSTLLKLIGGLLNKTNSNTSIRYFIDNTQVNVDQVYKYISYIAPYYNLYEDFSLLELFEIVWRMRGEEINKQLISDFEALLNDFKLLHKRKDKIKSYSSGMKQRSKIVLGLLNDSPFYLFDEFSTNLDEEGIEITKSKILDLQRRQKVVIIATNEKHEQQLCGKLIHIR